VRHAEFALTSSSSSALSLVDTRRHRHDVDSDQSDANYSFVIRRRNEQVVRSQPSK